MLGQFPFSHLDPIGVGMQFNAFATLKLSAIAATGRVPTKWVAIGGEGYWQQRGPCSYRSYTSACSTDDGVRSCTYAQHRCSEFVSIAPTEFGLRHSGYEGLP